MIQRMNQRITHHHRRRMGQKNDETVSAPKNEDESKDDGVLGLDESEEMKNGDQSNQGDHPMFDSFPGTAEYELFLESYAWIGQCEFMTKAEVLEEFGKDGVQIYFNYHP